MLYIYYGTDIDTVHAKARKLISSLQTKKPDAAYYSLESGDISLSELDELTESQGLFEKKYIVYINQGLGGGTSQDLLLEKVIDLRDSENVFVLVEHTLKAPVKKKLEKAAHKIQEYSKKKEGRDFTLIGGGSVSTQVFNLFDLSDAYGARDRRKMWVLLQKAYRHSFPPEEIHGNLMWQTRMMLLATQSSSATEAQVKPFVYNKAKGYSTNYSIDELKYISKQLVEMYHNVRRGKGELDIAIERFVLGL